MLRTRFEERIKRQLNRLLASSLLGYLLPFLPYQPQAETYCDRYTIQRLQTERWRRYWLARYVQAHRHYDTYTRAPFRKCTVGRSARSHVFYDTEYFCQSLQPCFRLIAVERGAFAYQTALLFEKVC